jgi:hypothetical protein
MQCKRLSWEAYSFTTTFLIRKPERRLNPLLKIICRNNPRAILMQPESIIRSWCLLRLVAELFVAEFCLAP